MTAKGGLALYFHWPFCLSKCPYCDFNVHIRAQIDHDRWKRAYLKSLEHYAALMKGRVVISVFFGGGTPSLMRPETIARILDKVHALWPCANDMEITLEANPSSVENAKFAAFKDAGVNRVSLGVQALNDADLNFLGRRHDLSEALQALEILSKNFDRYNFDLIYARPDQSLESWAAELRHALTLAGGHMSLYQLTIERRALFYFRHAQGQFTMPDEDMAADFYLLTQDIMEGAGLPAYEVSNHAASGHESRHNLTYWHMGDYVGIGPGAHGRLTFDSGQRVSTREHTAPEIWLDRVEGERGCGAHPFQTLSAKDRFMEGLMMGLRLRDGVRWADLGGRDFIDEAHLSTARAQGWVEYDEVHIRPTREGLLRLNMLIPYILRQGM